MRILVEKAARRLTLMDGAGDTLLSCRIALGSSPIGPKNREGDGKTPEGGYFICLKKLGKYGPSLGLSYPNAWDALRNGADEALLRLIRQREESKERPPWGSPLGGEIYVHGGGADRDWTAGCIALSDADAKRLYDLTPLGTPVTILP
ncbi:MAG: L,D-transpeptidase [Clostridia bacterium]|nr:L,D-transpeptidase [Clostridia bacterium]